MSDEVNPKDEVNLRDITVERYAKEAVDMAPEAMEEEYVRLPADLAYWNERYARALKVFLTTKARSKTMAALLKIEHRERLFEEFQAKKEEKGKSGSGRVTDSMVDAALEQDERWQNMQAQLVDAEVEMVRVKGTAEAVRAKKDMLVSLGASIRAEIEGDPIVRKAHADAREFRRKG
jgi:hypothetical protein